MSHAKNKIDWCLKKAKEELSKGSKHRGLKEKNKDIEEAKKHITKAEHNLTAVSYFNEGGFSDWSMSAIFYCIYHCFLAIASKFGYESRNQECTIALIEYMKERNLIEIDEKYIQTLKNYNEIDRHESSIIEKRENYTYGTTTSISNKQELENSIQLCKDCLAQTKEIIFSEVEK
jgi:uncharacterized protein (UPF0332 family)